MTEDRALAANLTATPRRERYTFVLRDGPTLPPLVDVRCPQCRNLLARVSKGAAVEVKCIKCKTWLVTDAA